MLFSLNHQEKSKNSARHQQIIPKSAKSQDRAGQDLRNLRTPTPNDRIDQKKTVGIF